MYLFFVVFSRIKQKKCKFSLLYHVSSFFFNFSTLEPCGGCDVQLCKLNLFSWYNQVLTKQKITIQQIKDFVKLVPHTSWSLALPSRLKNPPLKPVTTSPQQSECINKCKLVGRGTIFLIIPSPSCS